MRRQCELHWKRLTAAGIALVVLLSAHDASARGRRGRIFMRCAPAGARSNVTESADAHFEQANVLMTSGDYSASIKAATRAIEVACRQWNDLGRRLKAADAYVLRAQAWEQLGKWPEAIADTTQAIRIASAVRTGRAARLVGIAHIARASVWRSQGSPEKAVNDLSHVIEMTPHHKAPYDLLGAAMSLRADAWRELQKWDHAIADCTRLIEHEPDSPFHRVHRAAVYFDQQRFDEGIADMQAAIRLNPGDLGANYEPTTHKTLSPEALKHGERQVRAMLKDRPAMAEHVSPGDELWTWAVRKFAGEDLGSSIDWDASDPAPFQGDCAAAENGRGAMIRIAAIKTDASEEHSAAFHRQWSTAVFELHNVCEVDKLLDLHNEARQGLIARDAYISASVGAEEPASQLTRAFYLRLFLPWARSKNVPLPNPSEWYCDAFYLSGSDRLAQWRSWPHWQYFGDWYDLIRTEQLFAENKFAEADAILSALIRREGTLPKDQASGIHYWQGHMHLRKGEPASAVAEFNKSLALDPTSRLVAQALAIARLQSGAVHEAIEDLTKLIQQYPDWPEPYTDRAAAWTKLGDRVKADRDLAQAARLQAK